MGALRSVGFKVYVALYVQKQKNIYNVYNYHICIYIYAYKCRYTHVSRYIPIIILM
jgi:hypothetical protein